MEANFVLDSNKIWTTNISEKIFYPTGGSDICFEIEDNSFWFLHRNNILKKLIKRFKFQDNFADIGGGNGFQANAIQNENPDIDVFLIEPSYAGCFNASKRGINNIYNCTFESFDFKKNKIGGVGLFDVVEHIENDKDFLINIKNSLPVGANIYITVPAHNWLWSDVDDLGGHFRRYDKKMFINLAHSTDLKLLYFSYFFSYIPPLTYFLRVLPSKILGKKNKNRIMQDEKQQHNPSKFILNIFELFHSWERRKIEQNSIKIGASCIAILRKDKW